MATTSGTVGQTQLRVVDLVEKAIRRCGKQPSTISGEVLLSARLSLFLLLTTLANRGLSLWCIDKHVLGVVPFAQYYTLPDGTVDVLTCLYRTFTALDGQAVSGSGYSGYDFGAPVLVDTVKVQPTAAAVFNLVVESSEDGLAWTVRKTLPANSAVAAGGWLCADVALSTEAQYWRVRDTSGTLPGLTSLVFANDTYEVPMSKINRDDFLNLPNKTFAVSGGSKSLQFWFDKQIEPRIWCWPTSNAETDQIVVWTQRQIQDVTTYTELIDVPQRWLESVLFMLASRIALELPPEELPQGRIEYLDAKAAEYLLLAEDGENDGAPTRITPNIRGYTA